MKFNVRDKVRIRTTGEIGTVMQVVPHDETETYVVNVDGKAYVCLPDFLEPAFEIELPEVPEPKINVKEDVKDESIEAIRPDFIRAQPADKNAAIRRKVGTEEYLDSWNAVINAANNREMPDDLKIKYNVAGQLIQDIVDAELDIICRR